MNVFWLLMIGGCLLGSAVVLVQSSKNTGHVHTSQEDQRSKRALSRSRTPNSPKVPLASLSALERDIQALSLQEIKERLPAGNLPFNLLQDSPEHEQIKLLLKRMGALEGERALDDLLARYQQNNLNQLSAATAMSFAILGWMEVDQEAALQALQELLKSDQSSLFPLMQWKGTGLLSGYG